MVKKLTIFQKEFEYLNIFCYIYNRCEIIIFLLNLEHFAAKGSGTVSYRTQNVKPEIFLCYVFFYSVNDQKLLQNIQSTCIVGK